MSQDWLNIDLSNVDTPALIIDQKKVLSNITKALEIAGGPERLRPHVKTHKMLDVAILQLKAGITKFKCATIAEAEMLGMAGVSDVLIAYPIQGPKIYRTSQLMDKFPDTRFSVLVDNHLTAYEINQLMTIEHKKVDVFIDINNGHNRTGIRLEGVKDLYHYIMTLPSLNLYGFHCYDGHIHMSSYDKRKTTCTKAFKGILEIKEKMEMEYDCQLTIVAGGSPTFPVHARNHNVECSPGTFVFWDEGYGSKYLEQGFVKAAVLATRVISKIDDHTYCLDLGYKSVASESPLPRVAFIDNREISQIGHSEEHLVVKIPEPDALKVGEILLAFPYHICPTVALYDYAHVVRLGKVMMHWDVIARKRKITI